MKDRCKKGLAAILLRRIEAAHSECQFSKKVKRQKKSVFEFPGKVSAKSNFFLFEKLGT